MKLLPIFWTEEPTSDDWARLTEARIALGYTDLIKPVRALPGSPGTLLVIGKGRPDWLHNFYACDDITDAEELQWALGGALGGDERESAMEELLSGWMGVQVKQAGEVPYEPSELG